MTFRGLLFEMSSVNTCTAPIRYLTLKVVSQDGTEDTFVENSYITVPINYLCVTPGTNMPLLWLISANGDGFGFRSLARRSIPKMGTVTMRESESVPVEKLCIIQCNDRVWNLNPNPNPSPSPLAEMSH